MSQVSSGVDGWCQTKTKSRKKNEFIIIGQKAIRESLAPNFPVPLLQNNISPSVEVKNLATPLTIMLPGFAEHVTIIFLICEKFANSLVLKLQYFWQTLWSVVVWTTVTLYVMG